MGFEHVEDLGDELGLVDIWIQYSTGAMRSKAYPLTGAYENDRHLRIENMNDIAEFEGTLDIALHIHDDGLKRREAVEMFAGFVNVVHDPHGNSVFSQLL